MILGTEESAIAGRVPPCASAAGAQRMVSKRAPSPRAGERITSIYAALRPRLPGWVVAFFAGRLAVTDRDRFTGRRKLSAGMSSSAWSRRIISTLRALSANVE